MIAACLMGIARSLLYEGKAGTPIYSLGSDFEVLDGAGNEPPSFFREYNFKLKKVYSGFYTSRAKKIAKARESAAAAFYEELFFESRAAYSGKRILSEYLESCF